ncbi:MAG TPA: hypothetical protein VK843_07470 [Planctomycetota bacterium]|nr:hypothetical protein [Planctomycetota bacterium]
MNSQSTQDRPAVAPRTLLRWEWLAWALLWCAARGMLLVSFADVFGYGEELEKACAGKAMLDGLGVPHHQLAYHYYEGGGFVVSHLDALAFALFGESLLAVKLAALALGAAILAAGWSLCVRLGGVAAARAFALLCIFAPISVQKLSLLTLGIHFHGLLFVALVLGTAARIILERDLRASSWLQLGLCAGFGLFFSYQLVVTIAVVACALVIALRSEILRKTTWWSLVGFAIGLLPLGWMAAHVGSAVFDVHGADLVASGAVAKREVLREFFVSIFADRSPLDLAMLVALCTFPLLGFFALRAGTERRLRVGAAIVLAHIAAFVLVYLASSFTIARVYHYFVLKRLTPLWWLAILFGVLGAMALWRSRRRWQQRLAAVAIAAAALLGAIDLLRESRVALYAERSGSGLVATVVQNLGTLAHTKGYAYPKYLVKLSSHLEGTTADKLRTFRRFDEQPLANPAAPMTLLDEGIAMALYGDGHLELAQIERELREAGIDDLRGFYLGLGTFLRVKFPRDIAMRARGVENLPPEVRDALIEGLGCVGVGSLATEDRLAREVQIGTDAQLAEAYYIGLGRRMHDAFGDSSLRYFEMIAGPWMLERERAAHFANRRGGAVADALMRGYDAALREHQRSR